MRPELAPEQLKHTRAWEYVVRFVFGGAITAVTGLIGHAWGPWIAGLFLAFPAILPASLTLVKQHDGRRQAIDDARGARLSTIALSAFAVLVIALADQTAAPVVLCGATIAWLGAALGLWFLRYGRGAPGA
jgi:uncharacterized membrane protein (GlpM family)